MVGNVIHVRADVDPMAQPRHKIGAGRRAYLPRKVQERLFVYKSGLVSAFICKYGRLPVVPKGVPVTLSLTFEIPMAASWSEKRKLAKEGTFHTSVPDADNLAKAVQDALCPKILYDDAQVAVLRVVKYWARTGSVEILIKQEGGNG